MLIFLLLLSMCFAYYFLKFKEKEVAQEQTYRISVGAYDDGDPDKPFSSPDPVSTTATPEVMNVKIQDNKVDTNRIISYTGQGIRKFEFRPNSWSQFIAQDEAKRQAQTIIKKVNRGIRGHFILGGLKGCGKTTFVELFAKSINATMIQYIGRQVNEENLPDIMNAINRSQTQQVVLFIDEIDTCDWKVLKVLNPIIEQFKINDKQIKPFIFASATINRHTLVKNNSDLLDRIPHSINFVRYTLEDLALILNQYKTQLYGDEKITNEVVYNIANACKYTPRIAISLLEDFVVETDLLQVLKNRNIIIEGLDVNDIKVLQRLSESKRAIGSNALALQIGINEQSYLREVEPYLLEFGYIQRVPSRIITAKGLDILRQIGEK